MLSGYTESLVIFLGVNMLMAASVYLPTSAGLISLGTPVAVEGRLYTYEFLRHCAMPKLFVSGSRDQYSTGAGVEKLVEMAPEPKELVIVEGADHFFEGRLNELQTAIRDWTERYLASQKKVEAS